MRNIKELAKALHLKIKDPLIYERALTHPSYNADAKTKHQDYEKLEFMGDAVLGYVCADLVYKFRPNMQEGNLTKLRSNLVSTKPLASYAKSINLQDYVRVGKSINLNNVNLSDKNLEDIFEALVGAIYLDLGLHTAYEFIKPFLYDQIINIDEETLTDYKTRLQEAIQAEHRDAVKYVTVETSGPAHDRTFTVNVLYNDIILGVGKGKSKKEAEEYAAKDAMNKRSVI